MGRPAWKIASPIISAAFLLIVFLAFSASSNAKTFSIEDKSPINILAAPSIEVTYNGFPLNTGQTISSSPEIDIRMTSSDGIDSSTFVLLLNSQPVTSRLTTIESTTNTYEVLYTPSLAAGAYDIRVQIRNNLSDLTTRQINDITVSDTPSIIGTPKNYPNPFKPGESETTTIKYQLSKNMAIRILIFETNGRLVWQRSYSSGASGGSAGFNKVSWNGKSDFQETVGNGVYLYFILTGSRVLGSGEIAVYD